MTPIYLFAAIVGLGLLALGALAGEGGDHELDTPEVGGTGADAPWKQVFSLRSASYFMAGFGATGLALTLLNVAPALTAILSLGMGGFAAAVVLVLFGWIRATEGGFGGSADDYVGAMGRVRIPIRPATPGSVDIEHRGRVLTMRARAAAGSESDPSSWTDVLVVDVDHESGVLLVEPLDRVLGGPGDTQEQLEP